MKNFANSRVGAVVLGTTALVVLGGSGAYAARQINSSDIKDQTIQSRDIHSGGVGQSELKPDAATMSKLGPGIQDKVNGVPGTLKNPYDNGPYPGATHLQHGDNSTESVPADGAEHTVWVSCAPGDVVTGGGFRLAADSTQAAAEAIKVIASEPTQVQDGKIVYTPIDGDPDGAFRGNAWAVEVVNNGDSTQIVRPWIICTPMN